MVSRQGRDAFSAARQKTGQTENLACRLYPGLQRIWGLFALIREKAVVEMQMAQTVWQREPVCVACGRDISGRTLAQRCDPTCASAALLWNRCRLLCIWLRKAEIASTLCSPQVETVLGRDREPVAEQSRPVGAAESSLERKRLRFRPPEDSIQEIFKGKFF
jgi:hypothetical protein